ncbi:hypothetical protein Tco_1019316 [Tanacetum coccineum]|uniref:Uncharacterized protein n=1 Tax=Tanacetum coccineum TaxID=301880 RepID=A0ABQ5FWT3_9ASTR
MSRPSIRRMVWSGYIVLMSGKTDSIKLNNILGCLPGSTFVYSEVFKLDFSSASTHLKSSLFSILLFLFGYDACILNVLTSYGAELTVSLVLSYINKYKQKDKDMRIMDLAAAGPVGLWRCWPRQSCV